SRIALERVGEPLPEVRRGLLVPVAHGHDPPGPLQLLPVLRGRVLGGGVGGEQQAEGQGQQSVSSHGSSPGTGGRQFLYPHRPQEARPSPVAVSPWTRPERGKVLGPATFF